MAIALEDLCRARSRLQPEPFACDPLDLGIDRRILPDRAGELADPHAGDRALHTCTVTVEPERPARELQPERRGLGMDAVRAPHAQRLPVLLGAADDRLERAVEPLEHDRACVLHGERECGVQHVGRRQPEVEPTAVRAERLADGVDECRYVVVRLPLELGDPCSRRRPRRERIRSMASAGTTPTALQPSSAASSTSSIRASLASSDQISVMAGRA